MFESIKIYGAAVVTAVLAMFVAIYQFRGMKVAELTDELEDAEAEALVKDKVVAAENKVNTYKSANAVAAVKAAQPKDWSDTHAEDPTSTFYSI